MTRDTVWDRAPHTQAKHDILVRYLRAWYAIFGGSRFHTKVAVLDGFAGPGRYSDGSPGSPVLALDALLSHDHFPKWNDTEFLFLFNESDPERKQVLDQSVADFRAAQSAWPKNVKCMIEGRAFQDLASDLLDGVEPGKTLVPLFSFVDPFGYAGIPLDLIKRLVAFRAGELFIYFDVNSAIRFASAGVADKALTALFGTDKYKDAPVGEGTAREDFLHDLYEQQLRAECNFAHVRSFGLVGKNGKTISYLFFCTRDLQAFDRMKEAMWKASSTGDFRFEDRLADQSILFGNEPDTEPLKRELLAHFAGQTVTIQAVTEFVIASTPFCGSHVKRRTLKPMQDAGVVSSPNQRRKGTYPDGTLIVFPATS